MWITITVDDMLSGLSGPEQNAMRTAALAAGQGDPLAETILQVLAEVRGYVAACTRNQLDADTSKVPLELKADAIAIIRWRAANRLNVRSLLSASREKEYDRAGTKMTDVARCLFAVEQPENASSQITTGGAAAQVVSSTCRKSTRRDLAGL